MKYIDADKIIFHLKCEMDRSVVDLNITPVQCGIYFGLLYAKSLVDSAKTADVQEVRHGHWIREVKEIEDTVYFKAFCSVCNRRVIVKYNYCPHCGAKMDEEEQK